MTIKRFPYDGLGRCEAVVSDGIVYAVATDPRLTDGIVLQTQNALDELSRILENAGSGLAGLLQVTVYLADVKQKPEIRQRLDQLDRIGEELAAACVHRCRAR